METSDPRRRERTRAAFTPPGWITRWKEGKEERRNSGQEERVLQGEYRRRRVYKGGRESLGGDREGKGEKREGKRNARVRKGGGSLESIVATHP